MDDGRDQVGNVFHRLESFAHQPAYFLAYLHITCTIIDIIFSFKLLAFFKKKTHIHFKRSLYFLILNGKPVPLAKITSNWKNKSNPIPNSH